MWAPYWVHMFLEILWVLWYIMCNCVGCVYFVSSRSFGQSLYEWSMKCLSIHNIHIWLQGWGLLLGLNRIRDPISLRVPQSIYAHCNWSSTQLSFHFLLLWGGFYKKKDFAHTFPYGCQGAPKQPFCVEQEHQSHIAMGA